MRRKGGKVRTGVLCSQVSWARDRSVQPVASVCESFVWAGRPPREAMGLLGKVIKTVIKTVAKPAGKSTRGAGPSGQPKVHTKSYSSKKDAKEAAQHGGQGKPEHPRPARARATTTAQTARGASSRTGSRAESTTSTAGSDAPIAGGVGDGQLRPEGRPPDFRKAWRHSLQKGVRAAGAPQRVTVGGDRVRWKITRRLFGGGSTARP